MQAFETDDFQFSILENGNLRLEKCKSTKQNYSIQMELFYKSKKHKITEIGNHAFSNCNNLKTIKIPAIIETIGESCFSSCSVENVEFEQNSQLKKLGDFAFLKCNKLKSIKITSNVESIGNNCFYESSIENIEFENESLLKIIGDNAFGECKNLKMIRIPPNVEYIGKNCFSCSSLNEIYIQSTSSITLGENCFSDLPEGFKVFHYQYCNLLGDGVPSESNLFIFENSCNQLSQSKLESIHEQPQPSASLVHTISQKEKDILGSVLESYTSNSNQHLIELSALDKLQKISDDCQNYWTRKRVRDWLNNNNPNFKTEQKSSFVEDIQFTHFQNDQEISASNNENKKEDIAFPSSPSCYEEAMLKKLKNNTLNQIIQILEIFEFKSDVDKGNKTLLDFQTEGEISMRKNVDYYIRRFNSDVIRIKNVPGKKITRVNEYRVPKEIENRNDLYGFYQNHVVDKESFDYFQCDSSCFLKYGTFVYSDFDSNSGVSFYHIGDLKKESSFHSSILTMCTDGENSIWSTDGTYIKQFDINEMVEKFSFPIVFPNDNAYTQVCLSSNNANSVYAGIGLTICAFNPSISARFPYHSLTLEDYFKQITSVCAIRNKFLSCITVASQFYHTIYVIEENTFTISARLVGHTSGVSCLISNDRNLYSGSIDGSIRVWDLSSKKSEMSIFLGEKPIIAMTFGIVDNTKFLISCDIDKIYVIDLSRKNLAFNINLPDKFIPRNICFDQNNIMLSFLLTSNVENQEQKATLKVLTYKEEKIIL